MGRGKPARGQYSRAHGIGSANIKMQHGSLFSSFAIQRRVIGALLMREVITRYGRDNLGVLWLFFEPMLFTLGVLALWVGSGLHHSSQISIVAFSITGYSSVLVWRNCANRCSMAIQANLNLLYHRNVRVLDLFLTRVIIEICGATTSFFILSTIFTAAGLMDPPADTLRVLQAWLLLSWFGTGLALTIGGATAYSDTVEKLWHPISYILFPLSGAATMVDWLPKNLQDAILLLPMVHGVEMLRDGFFGSAVRTHYDVAYMSLSCLVLSLVGLMLVAGAGRRVEVP
jgi:capsular polysaccharide transport system permease protein